MTKHRTAVYLAASLLSFFVVFTVALMVGRYRIGFASFFNAIFTDGAGYDTERSVILNLRIPRTIVAGLTGIALSLSGLLYQETFQNKLTSPDLLGVSHGAGVGAAIAIVCGLSSVFVSMFAFAIGILTVLMTLTLAKLFRNGSSMILLLSGIIVGGLMSSVLALVKYFAGDEVKLASITYWLMGSFANSTMKEVYILLPVVTVCAAYLLIISWRINIVALGREEAQTKGINYKLYRYLIIGIATLLTASTVAFCGTISWVGLVIPHIVRLLVGRDTKKTIPLCATSGGVFMIVVDVLSRTFTSEEIPLSAVTGLFGTIIFIAILFTKRREYNEY